MSESGPYDFPPKKQERKGDQESVTQPGQQPGEDLETAEQGAGVPVQHQSSGSELTYRLSQPIHQSAQLQPLSPHSESASSFTCDEFELPSLYSTSAQSAPSSPSKLSSPNVTRSSSVPVFVYRTSQPYRTTQSYRSSNSPLSLESSTSSQPPQDYSFDQQFQAQSFPRVTAIEQLELSGNQPLHSQQPQLQIYEDLPTHQQSPSYQLQLEPSGHEPLHSRQPQLQTYVPVQTHQQSQYYQQPQLHDQSQNFTTQQLETADLATTTAAVAPTISSQSNPQPRRAEQLELPGQHQPLLSQQLLLHQQYHPQTYKPLETHQKSDSSYQAQFYEELQDFVTRQLVQVDSNTASDEVPSSTLATNQGLKGQVSGSYRSSQSSFASESSSPSQSNQDCLSYQQSNLQSHSQFSPSDQLQLYQQSQPKTHDQFKPHQQSESQTYDQPSQSNQDCLFYQQSDLQSHPQFSPSDQLQLYQQSQPDTYDQFQPHQQLQPQAYDQPSQSNQGGLSYQRSDLQSHPQFLPSDQLQLYQQSQTETQDQLQPHQQSQPQTYDQPSQSNQDCLFYQQSDLQSHPQFSPSDQLQLYQQSQPQTYDQFQPHQQSQSYQQLEPYQQSQSSPSLQSVTPDLAFVPFSLRTQQGSTRQVSGNPLEKATCKRKFPCGYCNEASFDSEAELKKHRKSVHKKIRCRIGDCKFTTVDQKVLEEHEVENHKGESDTHNIQQPNQGAAKPDSPKSSDPAPSLSSSDQGNVDTSRKPTQGPKKKKVKCEIDNCNYVFKDQNSLRNHVVIKHKAEQCTECYFYSTSKQKLKDHMIQNHPDTVQEEAMAFPTYSPEQNPQPPVSNTGPSSSQPNPLPKQGQPTKEKANLCLKCGEQSSSIHHFEIHKKMHLEFKCQSCETYYNKVEGLDYHKKSIFHTSRAKLCIYCKHCNDEFETLREFKRHCENVMIKGGTEKCPTCGEPYTKHSHTVRHYALMGDEHFDVCAPSLLIKQQTE